VRRLERAFRFRNFAKALRFTNRVGALAEDEGHHPAILTEWGRVTVTLWTHKIRGFTGTTLSWRSRLIPCRRNTLARWTEEQGFSKVWTSCALCLISTAPKDLFQVRCLSDTGNRIKFSWAITFLISCS
jgi:hypothetical protein